MPEKKKKILIVAITCIIVTILGISYYFIKISEEEYFIFDEDKSNMENINNIENTVETEKEKQEIVEKKKIVVHIAGQVERPGVISLNEGARIIDAINEAGGSTKDADLSKVNLAYVLEDAQKIYIPSVNEEENVGYVSASSGPIVVDGSNDMFNKKAEKVMVNINTANEAELQKIPGIGQTIAARIVTYRKENGKFKAVEDIQNVSGIGKSKFNKIKEYICLK